MPDFENLLGFGCFGRLQELRLAKLGPPHLVLMIDDVFHRRCMRAPVHGYLFSKTHARVGPTHVHMSVHAETLLVGS